MRPMMTRLTRPMNRGEIILSVVLVSLLVGIMLRQLGEYMVAAENGHVLAVRFSLQNAVQLQAIDFLLNNRAAELASLEGTNPVNRFATPPESYMGELSGERAKTVEPGSWYFDKDEKALVYRVRNADDLVTIPVGADRIRFGVKLHFIDHNANGRFDFPGDSFRSVYLRPVQPFQWRGLQ